jgi:hypothetical protein
MRVGEIFFAGKSFPAVVILHQFTALHAGTVASALPSGKLSEALFASVLFEQ